MKKNPELTIYKAFKKVLIVQIVSAMAAFIGVLVDSLVISRCLGTTDMAGLGFVQPVILVFAAIALIFSTGTQAISGKLLGRGDTDSVNSLCSLAAALSVILGIVFTVVCFIFSKNIASIFGATGDALSSASDYLKGVAPGITFMILGPVLTAFMQIDNDIPRSYISVGVMTAVNIALDICAAVIFKWGMLGMGLATSIGNFVNVVILLLHFTRPKNILSLSLKKIGFSHTLNLFKTGFPAANQQICIVVRTAILNILLLSLPDGGTGAVAAFTTQGSVMPLILGIINGFGATVLLVSSVIIGEDDKTTLKTVMGKAINLGICVSLFIACVILFGSQIISGFFVSSEFPEQLELVARVFRFYAVSIPLTMLSILLINSFQSMGKLVLANILSLLENAVFIILVSYALSDNMGTDGVWISFLIAEVFTLLTITVTVIFSGKHLPRHTVAFLMIPREFSVPKEMRLNLSATTVSEAASVSQKITDFCTERNIDRKRAMFSGLCMEEMAVLALENAEKNGKKCQVDVFLEISGDKLTIRLKDNGMAFDPTAQQRLLNPDDPASNVAIRMFFRLVKEVNYTNLFDLNMLTFSV